MKKLDTIYPLVITFIMMLAGSPLYGQRLKAIIDADSGNEIDDMPTIVLAIKSDKLDILSVNAAQWNRYWVCGRETMIESWDLNNRILEALDIKQIPSLKGAEHEITQQWGNTMMPVASDASHFIVKKALEIPEGEKLVIIITGSATNVASAILSEPLVVDKIAVYYIGMIYDFDREAFNKNEYNTRSDLNAVETLLNTKNLELHVMPANICTKLLVKQEDINNRLRPDYNIDKILLERWNEINKDRVDWIMWDFAIVQAVLNPNWTKQIKVRTPPENTPRDIYLYTWINDTAMISDFWNTFLK